VPPLAVIVILAFATYRITRLCTTDTISLRVREAIYHWAWIDPDPDDDSATATFERQRLIEIAHENGWTEIRPRPRAGYRTWFNALVTCDQCLGVWWGVAVYCLWRFGFDGHGDLAGGILTVAALCGVQSILAWGAATAEATIDAAEAYKDACAPPEPEVETAGPPD
jgi:hypothetical protein